MATMSDKEIAYAFEGWFSPAEYMEVEDYKDENESVTDYIIRNAVDMRDAYLEWCNDDPCYGIKLLQEAIADMRKEKGEVTNEQRS